MFRRLIFWWDDIVEKFFTPKKRGTTELVGKKDSSKSPEQEYRLEPKTGYFCWGPVVRHEFCIEFRRGENGGTERVWFPVSGESYYFYNVKDQVPVLFQFFKKTGNIVISLDDRASP